MSTKKKIHVGIVPAHICSAKLNYLMPIPCQSNLLVRRSTSLGIICDRAVGYACIDEAVQRRQGRHFNDSGFFNCCLFNIASLRDGFPENVNRSCHRLKE